LRLSGRPAPHPARLVDLSRGGLRCAVDPDLPVRTGDAVEVELRLGDATVSVYARVMHIGKGELGLQFLAPDPAVAARIDTFMTGAS